jgi:hypothetical protein
MKAPTALGLAVLLVLGMVGAAPAADLRSVLDTSKDTVVQLDLGAADAEVITSGNVEYVGTIPLDSPGVGGEVVVRDDLDGQKFFYATGGKGLTIYDVTNPALPEPVGILALPHSQNEDLKVSRDGTRAVIGADGGLLLVNPVTTGVHIIDTTDVTNPQVVGSTNEIVAGTGGQTGSNEHTVACADFDCNFIYGSSSGSIYDATDPSDIQVVGQWNIDFEGQAVGGRHALNLDDSGLLISDSHPRLVLDPREDPANPVLLAIGERSLNGDNRLQHNNVRPDSVDWEPRAADDEVEWVSVDRTETVPNVVIPDHDTRDFATERPVMGAGEIMIGNSETNINNACSAAGGLSTWSMIDFDKGAEMVQLEVFRPLNGNWADGNPARNALGCSGHWFTENDGIVTASWYEHGVRFFDVDKTTGTIDQVGFFQPVATLAGAAYWIDDEYVYSMDYARGLDILRFDRDGDVPDQSTFDASWEANLSRVGALGEAERLFCRLAAAD